MSSDPVRPLTSVIIPCRDAGDYLPDALRSVADQGVSPLEVIVVDDGSTVPCGDAARAALPGTQVAVHSEPRGPAAARNTGLRIARGALIAFLDADDVWVPGSLARLIDRLWAQAETQFITGATEIVCMPTNRDADHQAGRILRPARTELLLPATVFRRSVIDAVGLFDESLRFGEDADWFLRARERGVSYATSAERFLLYRRHDRNMTCGQDLRGLFVPQTIIRSIRRRRAQGLNAIPPVPAPEDQRG